MLTVVGVIVVIAVLAIVVFKIDCVLFASVPIGIVVIDDIVVVSLFSGIFRMFGLMVVVEVVKFNALLSFAFKIDVTVVVGVVGVAPSDEFCKDCVVFDIPILTEMTFCVIRANTRRRNGGKQTG